MFVRIELIQSGLIPFSSIHTHSIALGKNLLVTRVGNKGGVSCHLDLNPAVFCPSLPSPLPLHFVCCHLAADTNGESKLDRRNRDAKYAPPPLPQPKRAGERDGQGRLGGRLRLRAGRPELPHRHDARSGRNKARTSLLVRAAYHAGGGTRRRGGIAGAARQRTADGVSGDGRGVPGLPGAGASDVRADVQEEGGAEGGG